MRLPYVILLGAVYGATIKKASVSFSGRSVRFMQTTRAIVRPLAVPEIPQAMPADEPHAKEPPNYGMPKHGLPDLDLGAYVPKVPALPSGTQSAGPPTNDTSGEPSDSDKGFGDYPAAPAGGYLTPHDPEAEADEPGAEPNAEPLMPYSSPIEEAFYRG